MNTVFVYYNPHPIHKAWADSVTDKQVPFVSKGLFDIQRIRNPQKSLSYRAFEFLRTHPYVLQPIAIADSFRIPKADTYLIENASCILPTAFRKRKDSKIILINDDIFFYLIRESRGFMRKRYLKSLRHIDGIISSSEMIRKVSQEFTDVPNEVVYPFADTEKYAKFDADMKSRDIAFTGMLANQKRMDLIIKAFLKVQPKFKNKLYLIGKEEDKIEELDKNRDNKDIIVTGWTPKPEEYLKKSGFYINPAEREAFGMAIMEAMLLGIPPLVSAKCGAAEIVAKVSKELVIKQDVDDIVKKLLWLDSNPTIKKRLSKECKKEALKYTKERSQKEFRQKFNKMVEELTR